jgi:hypothetical protein
MAPLARPMRGWNRLHDKVALETTKDTIDAKEGKTA